MSTAQTVYISIGNSDDKLTQAEWSRYVHAVDTILLERSGRIAWSPIVTRHGSWLSVPDDPWQNACWCVEIDRDPSDLKDELRVEAQRYRQDSISWAEARTEFLTP